MSDTAGRLIDLASEGGRHVPGTPYEWSHGWVPLNAAAKAEKAKYLAAHAAWLKKVENHHTEFRGHHGVAIAQKHSDGGFETRVMRTHRTSGRTDTKPTIRRFKTEGEAHAHASKAVGAHTVMKPRKPQLGDHVSGENLKAARKAMADAKKPSAPKSIGPSDAEKIKNAEKMFGTGSKQHQAALRRFGSKTDLTGKMDMSSPQKIIDQHATGDNHFVVDKRLNPHELVAHTIHVHAESVKHEKSLTKIVKSAAASTGGTPQGLEYRQKELGSTLRKVHADAVESLDSGQPKTPAEVAKALRDLNRYTITYDKANFGNSAQALLDELRRTGHTVDVKNYFANPDKGSGYQGLHYRVTSPDGHNWELQVHTPESLATKEPSHAIYNQSRKVGISPKMASTLGAQSREMWASVPRPQGHDMIESKVFLPSSRKK